MEPANASQDLNAILQGMDISAEGTENNPVVYPAGLPHLMSTGAPVLSSVTSSMPPIQVDIPRLIGGVFQRIDALQTMLLQRIDALENRLTALEKRASN
jgi:hypothetical protein